MRKLLLWGIPTVAVVGLVIWRFANLHAANAQVNKQRGGGAAAEVQVIPASGRVIEQKVQGVGTIQSPQVVEVSPISPGRIDFLAAREGDVVAPGELLLKIDPSDLEGALLQQQAALAEARARLAQAKVTQNSNSVGVRSQIQVQKATLRSAKANLNLTQQNYNAEVAAAQGAVTTAQSGVANAQAALSKENSTLANLQVVYDRNLNLFKQGFSASQDVDNAKTAVDVEKGSVGVAQAMLKAAQAQLGIQQNNLSIAKSKGTADIQAAKATVAEGDANVKLAQANKSSRPAFQENLNALQSEVSAAAAQVTQAQAKLAATMIYATSKGTVTARKADPGDLATPGSPVLEVQFLDWLYVTSTLPIDFSSQIKAGQIANITIDGLPGRKFSGPITNINPAADPLSRQFGIKVRLENADHTVRPGMYGRVTIITDEVNAPVVIPKEAITTSATGVQTVAVVDAKNVAHVRTITTGVTDDAGSQVLTGVSPGDLVVTLTYNALKEGQKVKISQPMAPGAKGKNTQPPTVSVKANRVKQAP